MRGAREARIGGTAPGTCAGMGTCLPAVTEALAATPGDARRAALARLGPTGRYHNRRAA